VVIQANADGSVTIDVRVVPRASKAGVAGRRGESVVIRVHAPPVDDAANAELIEVLSSVLGCAKRALSIVAGARTRQKRVRVVGLDVPTVEAKLLTASPAPPEG